MTDDRWIKEAIKRLDQQDKNLQRQIDNLKGDGKQLFENLNPKTAVLIVVLMAIGLGITVAVATTPELVLDR